jgi:hypothetical protein
MTPEVFQIPTYQIDQDADFGQYLFLSELEKEANLVLRRPDAGDTISVQIPRLPEVSLCVRRLGEGFELTTVFGGAKWGTSFLAIDEPSAQQVCKAALDCAARYGWTEDAMAPEWRTAMARDLPAPFSVVIYNRSQFTHAKLAHGNAEKIQMATGFIQAVMATALKRAGCKSTPLSQEGLLGALGLDM